MHTSVHEVEGVEAASELLDVTESLCHVIEVGRGCVANLLVLPVGKAVGQAMACQLCTRSFQPLTLTSA